MNEIVSESRPEAYVRLRLTVNLTAYKIKALNGYLGLDSFSLTVIH